jgi:hypothetical protein
VWEVRVVVGFDPVRGRSVQRSFTVHGDHALAQRRRAELVADFGVTRVNFSTEAARLNVGELMERFFEAPHLWKPATVVSHRPPVRALMADELARRRLVNLTPAEVRAAILRWQQAGASVATVSQRWLVLRSALSWATAEGILRSNPLAGMRGPSRPQPRLHHSPAEVHRLLTPPRRSSRKRPQPCRPRRPRSVACARCSPPSKPCWSCCWPPTRWPAGVSSPYFGSGISTAGC